MFDSKKFLQEIGSALADIDNHSSPGIQAFKGDGSFRRFFRIHNTGRFGEWPLEKETVIAILPPPSDGTQGSEARAHYQIALHLQQKNVAVPRVFGFDQESGLLIFEDLGHSLLYDAVQQQGTTASMFLYKKAVEELVRFQINGREGFNTDWCFDTPLYDRELMLVRESGYFLERFWQGFLGQDKYPIGIINEFEQLAEQATQAPNNFLLHRDFQSRNLMVCGKEVRIIDFQGARLGPLSYDLASLLIDPYVCLDAGQTKELTDYYISLIENNIFLDRSSFLAEYYCMSLQRNLQILGAFAFLTTVRKKTFFNTFIIPALSGLADLLHNPIGGSFPLLGRMVMQANELLRQRIELSGKVYHEKK